ncbi:FecR domain-containing protein [Chitinophaga sp.]|uniref:FecR family protein n=1 Tax=Chitinophaga sp. TaxID=1869181 RepID=UPI0031D8E7D2
MEDNNQYDELLVRYLFNEETAQEKAIVENWLNASEENLRHFNRLKKTWQLTEIKKDLTYIMDEANLEDKWNRLEQDITEEVERPSMRRMLISIAVAASVLLVVGLGWIFFSPHKPGIPIAQHTETKNDSLAFAVRHDVNTTGKEKRIQLADGSLIILANNSEVTYREPFADKREITLIGKAYFKVAHDKAKPFTVTSGDISTTVLGTEFTITAFRNTSHIIIRLYNGKVVIKAVDKTNKRMKNDVYLLPGQEFVYGGQTAIVRTFSLHNNAAPEQIMTGDDPSLPDAQDRPYFMFNNQQLGEVFDNLAALYNVEIVYNKKDIQKIYFTRKYNRTDSLDTILKEIGTIHHLTITRKDNAYIISR